MTRVVSLLLFCAFGIAGLALVFWWLLSSGWEVDTRRDAPPERGTQVSGEPVPGDAVDGSDAPEAGARSDEVDRQKAAPEAPVLGGVTYAGRVTNLEGRAPGGSGGSRPRAGGALSPRAQARARHAHDQRG